MTHINPAMITEENLKLFLAKFILTSLKPTIKTGKNEEGKTCMIYLYLKYLKGSYKNTNNAPKYGKKAKIKA